MPKHTLVALGCALALAGGSALAEQEAGQPQSGAARSEHSTSGGGFLDKTKEAFHRLGQTVKSGFHKAEGKGDATASDAKSMGAHASDTGSSAAARQQRMDEAYGDAKRSGAAKEPRDDKR
jgi:hypothetical protein